MCDNLGSVARTRKLYSSYRRRRINFSSLLSSYICNSKLFCKIGCTNRGDHKLLKGKSIASVFKNIEVQRYETEKETNRRLI